MSTSVGGEDDNAILHSLLLCGALSIKATDIDIRRNGEDNSVSNILCAVSTLSAPIETDYILEIRSSHQELDKYSCSKRYVDMRNLASTLRGHAEAIVKHYEVKKDMGRSESGGGGGGGKKESSIFGSLERALQKPVEAMQYITNTESNSSNLVSDLDSIFRDGKMDGSTQKSSKRRTSEFLDQGSPLFVREVIIGVDEYYEAIYSEKRQFSKKTNWDHVKSVAERRKKIINSAFSLLIHAIDAADLKSVSKQRPNPIPRPLEELLHSLEKFLLTDVIVDEGKEGGKVVPQDLQTESSSSIGNSVVNPKSVRRRASILDREAEEKTIKEVAELVLAETEEESTDTEGGEAPVYEPSGILPDDPLDFGVTVAIGAILFKLLEGREINVQVDMILVFGIACALIGYRLACPSVVQVAKISTKQDSPRKKNVTIASPVGSPQRDLTPDRRRSRRNMLSRSDGAIDLSASKRRSLYLIQASMRNLKTYVTGEEEEAAGATEEQIVPVKTFPRFPSGAAIGSHLNCWSSPPSTNFHVRGSKYLKDKKKVPSEDFLFPCRGCDLFLTDNPPVNMGRNRSIFQGKLRDVPTFIVNYRLPWGVFLSYYEIPEKFVPYLRRGHGHGDLTEPLPSMANMTAGERAMCNFLLSDADEKNEVWKIVPVVVDGPWVVKKVVGGKPAIVGTKMPITYTYQPPEKGMAEYLEADLDIVSSAAARNILAVVRSYTQVLTIDLGFVVQGNKQEELPEQMMLGLRLHGLDPLTAELMPPFGDESAVPELDYDTGNETD